MSYWWIAFWLIEAALIGAVVVSKIFHKPSSADVEIGEEIGNMLLIGFAIVIGVIAFLIYAWHHIHFG